MRGPEWPKSAPDATELMRYLAARGLWTNAAAWELLNLDRDRYMALTIEMIGCHDQYLLLDALQDIDAQAADALAARIWQAADAGDSYGEWLWEWAEKHALDCDAIRLDGAATAKASQEATDD